MTWKSPSCAQFCVAAILLLLFTTLSPFQSMAQNLDLSLETQAIRLWSGIAPGAQGTSSEDQPDLTIFRPMRGQANGTAVVLAPGGAYLKLALNHEGRQVANYLNSLGITVFLLRYRLAPNYHYPVQLEDAQRAIRLVRSRAGEFGVLPDRIGMMGFSAGGHLTALAGTHFDDGKSDAADPIDRVSSRPDFLVLGYAVISLSEDFSQVKTTDAVRQALLGGTPSAAQLKDVSTDLQVSPRTPPTFLFSTSQDDDVPPGNSVAFYQALQKAHVPGELHIFYRGHHGIGLDLQDPLLGQWSGLLANWLRDRGLLKPVKLGNDNP